MLIDNFTQKESERNLPPELWIYVSYIFQSVFDTRIKRLPATRKSRNRQFLYRNTPKG